MTQDVNITFSLKLKKINLHPLFIQNTILNFIHDNFNDFCEKNKYPISPFNFELKDDSNEKNVRIFIELEINEKTEEFNLFELEVAFFNFIKEKNPLDLVDVTDYISLNTDY